VAPGPQDWLGPRLEGLNLKSRPPGGPSQLLRLPGWTRAGSDHRDQQS